MDYIFLQFADLRLGDPIIFCGLKPSATPQLQNFYPYKYKLKMLSFKLKDDIMDE